MNDEQRDIEKVGDATTDSAAFPTCPLDFNSLTVLSDSEISCTVTGDFMKTMKLSKDGNFILAAYEHPRVEVFAIDEEAIGQRKYYQQSSLPTQQAVTTAATLKSTKSIYPGESVYDFDWYPFVASTDPISQCFIVSSRDKPVQLYGVQDDLRCNYCVVNHLDELASATCVGFNLTGDKIFCGSTRLLTSFDIDVPGRNGSSVTTSETRHDPLGQRGIMSCISFNPDRSQTFAVGTYANSVAIYTEADLECVLELKDLGVGVTHVEWSPCGNYLWIGGRKSDHIACWDVRNTRSEVGTVKRLSRSNQKMGFHIDPWGKYLATGDQDGQLLIYDTSSFELKVNSSMESSYRYDCINSVQFHPFSALLFSSAGQRRYPEFETDSSSEDDAQPPQRKRKLRTDIDGGESESKVVNKLVPQNNLSSSLQIWTPSFSPICY